MRASSRACVRACASVCMTACERAFMHACVCARNFTCVQGHASADLPTDNTAPFEPQDDSRAQFCAAVHRQLQRAHFVYALQLQPGYSFVSCRWAITMGASHARAQPVHLLFTSTLQLDRPFDSARTDSRARRPCRARRQQR